MFLGIAEPVGRETIAELVSQLVEEVASDVIEGFLVEAAAIEVVAESIINEEISVVDIVNDEMELAMVSFAEGKCKCTDEVTTLKIELLRCQSLIQELSTKLEQHLPPFSEDSLTDNSTVNKSENIEGHI